MIPQADRIEGTIAPQWNRPAKRHDTGHNRLKAVDLPRLRQPGYHHDGGGLYLQVRQSPGGSISRSWVFRYTRQGKARMIGLGPLDLPTSPGVTLAEARQKARDCKRTLLEGTDPLEARKATERPAMTFQAAAEAYIASQEVAWKNAKHRAQWRATLTTYAYPVIGDLSVVAVDTEAVMRVLQPIWNDKPETASRVRGRIDAVIGWATANGYRQGENPARWSGHLDKLLPKKAKTAKALREAQGKSEHFEALAYNDLPAFIAAIHAKKGTAAPALEFLILTASRTSEVTGARWSEIDLTERVWIVPASRMKAAKDHRVPLSDRALAILGEAGASDDFVFAGGKPGHPLSNMAMAELVKGMGCLGSSGRPITVHGFRSTFMDWAIEQTHYPEEMRDMALAHTVSDKVRAAYQRSDLFERRRGMMQDWARFATGAA